MYQEFYNFGQGTGTASGPVRFDIYGAEPTYLIINGQSRPYDPNYVSADSLWIQGRTSWTQYIKCPMNAQVMMLALSNRAPATMIETYADGHQEVNQYYFYLGYTQLVFAANAVGRHTLTFYINGHYSNAIAFDVIPYGGSYVSGYTSTAGLPYSISGRNQGFGSNTFSGSGRILIDSSDQGFDPNAPPEGYSNSYTQSGRILVDSSNQGFDPLATPIGEAI
ncbi:Uncharacterised protein [uncultured archaeon]|nr:Uncharacterised protein [uncultured archaeon]